MAENNEAAAPSTTNPNTTNPNTTGPNTTGSSTTGLSGTNSSATTQNAASVDEPNPDWHRVDWEPLLHGVAELETTDNGVKLHRLPRWVLQQFPDPQLKSMEVQPSGVKLAFRTTARAVALQIHSSRTEYKRIERQRGQIDTHVNGELHARDQLTGGSYMSIDLGSGNFATFPGENQVIDIDLPQQGEKLVEIWLAHNETIMLRGLSADAELHPVVSKHPVGFDHTIASNRPLESKHPVRWLHHGSSISHGSNATSPSEIWPAIVARNSTADLRNLGFGGSALLDPFMARVIRDAPADLITLKLGINVVNHDSMTMRSFVPALHGFLDTIRDGHPDTPIVVISPIYCGIHEETPGPLTFDHAALAQGKVQFVATGDPHGVAQGKLNLQQIRTAMHDVLLSRQADSNLHYIDGLELFGQADAVALPLDDGLHPTPEIHRLIGQRFAELVAARTGMLGC